MRVLVLEFVSGGGLAGRPCPPSLAREGYAMRAALLEDVAHVPGLDVIATTDPRFPATAPAGVRLVPVRPGDGAFPRLLAETDAVWLIAPESGGHLARLAGRVERAGRMLLGPSPAAIRAAADKLALARRLAARGIPAPATYVLAGAAPPPLPFPLVVKPARGAGGLGVGLARDARSLTRALARARAADPRGRVLAQSYVAGTPVSVSLVADDEHALPLALNAQHMRAGATFAYGGGETPLDHPLAACAIRRALQACAAIPGLRGYVGVDLVLTDDDAVVIEINPRLTTSYLGIRRALAENPAALALEAALGRLPARARVRSVRRVRFDSAGAVLHEQPLAAEGRTRAREEPWVTRS